MELNFELGNNQPIIKTIIIIIKLIENIEKASTTENTPVLEELKHNLKQTYGLITLSKDILKNQIKQNQLKAPK
jgi:hypothetical protein